jgi:OOP family OmpA-OmpF porin
VKFDFDKSVVKPNSYGDIKNLADFMKQYPATTTTVEGHTDSVGPDAYNQKLSERRANAVKQVLTQQYGVERPAFSLLATANPAQLLTTKLKLAVLLTVA